MDFSVLGNKARRERGLGLEVQPVC